MSRYIQVITTVSKKRDADRIADIIINKRLGSCVQIAGPIKSIYRWKGKIETAREWICIIKTKKAIYRRAEKAIREIHPYEVPEIIAVPIIDASKDYLRWISAETIKK